MKPFALQKEDAAEGFDTWALSGSEREPADFCSREGANALKEKIEAYWRDRGHNVMIALHNVGFHPAIRAARFDVRSDMVNGMPRRAGAKRSEPIEVARVEDYDLQDDELSFE